MNILVIRFSSLGDLVTLEPTFRAVRHFFSTDRITLLTTGVGKELYADTGYFDEFVLHDGIVSSIRKLGRYDLILNLQCNKPSHLVSLFTGYRKVVNKSYNFWQKLFGIKVKPKTVHEILLAMGVDAESSRLYWSAPESEIISLPVDSTEKRNQASGQHIVISTGSSERWKSKQWGVENYLAVIEGLLAKKMKVTLVGSGLELDDAGKIQKRFPEVVNRVARTSLTELKSVLAEADLYIGNDSGPSHIAAAVGCRTITIFGPTDVIHCVKNLDYASEHICIRPGEDIKCHPCYLPHCPTRHECMQDISPQSVLESALLQLKSG